MKRFIFSLLAVFLFSVNVVEAKEKKGLRVKVDTISAVQKAMNEAPKKPEKQTIVYITDTVHVQSVDIMNLDWSTPKSTKESIAYLVGLLFMLLPRFIPQFNRWTKKEKNTQALKVIGALLVIIIPIGVFGFNKSDIWDLVKEVLMLVGLVGGIVGLGINPLSRLMFPESKK